MGHLEDRAGLAGRRAMVIGGGGGLGRGCALDLAAAGMPLVLADRDEAGLAETLTAIDGAGGEATGVVLDARDAEAVSALFAGADEQFGGALDVLVNVVGGTFRQPFVDTTPKGWDTLIRTNFTWLLHSTQLAIPRMTTAGGGSIITLTTIEAHRAAPGYAVYAAMKAAATSLARTLAVELAPLRIRVNTVAPDYVPTPSLEALMVDDPPEGREARDRIAIPMGRPGTTDDVTGCVLFLASELSSFVTGCSLHPDGGALASAGWFNWPSEGFLNHPPQAVVEDYMTARSTVVPSRPGFTTPH